jgi:MerR family transcriptional regulator, redox-sensitive transcriptional activator SoxR
MTIGEVAARSGIPASAIRYYEKKGLLGVPVRASGRRVYDSGILHPLVIIRFAKETGFTLPEIRLLLRGFPAQTSPSVRWKKMAVGKINELERTLAKGQVMKEMLEAVMSCRCQDLAQCARSLGSRSAQSQTAQERPSRQL